MWLLALLLALMASGFARPDPCECQTSGKFKRIVCHGKARLDGAELNGATHLAIGDSDELEVTGLFDRLQNSSVTLDTLALTNCSLCALNVSWYGLEDLRNLNLSGNHFAEVRRAIAEDGALVLANLTVLDLSYNHIKEVEADAFDSFGNLLWLGLRGNAISRVDERGFEGLSSLEHLDLADNRLDTLPSGALGPLDALQKLDLSGNKLQVLGASWFETLTRLRELDVSRNGLAKAASGVLQPLPGLSVLRLAENPLRERDVSLLLGTGRRLETVDASRTGLVRVPAALTRSVRALRLAGNKLMSIRGGDLDSYPLLRLLDLSNNRLTVVEEDALGRLEVLEELDISGNVLSNVPRSLPSSLTTLDLSRNAIGTIKFNDLQGLYNVRNLSLNENAIAIIEEGSLSQLPALHMLDISNNPIKLLTVNALSGPNDLAVLRMSGLSQLEDRGNEGDMAFPVPAPERLTVLDVSHSPILATQLLTDEAALSACKSLQVLDLAYTNITSIEPDLTYVMPQLHTLGLNGNDWNCSADQFWLGDWLRQHEEMSPRSRCFAPDNIAGKYLIEMPSIVPTTQPPSPNSSARNPRVTSDPSMSSSVAATDVRRASSISDLVATLISRKTGNTNRDANGISTASDSQSASKPTAPLPTQHSSVSHAGVMRSYSRSAGVTSAGETNTRATHDAFSTVADNKLPDKIDNGSAKGAGESRALRTFKRIFLSDAEYATPTKVYRQDPVLDNSIMSNDIANTIAEELNGKVTDPGARLAPEPLSAGPHPGMLVLAGAALGAATILTIVLSRRATRRSRDKYHRHENIEVHSLTPTTELW